MRFSKLWKVLGHFLEFSKATSIHGLKYITEEKRHWLERGFNKTLKEDDYYGFVQQLAEIIQPEQVDAFHYNITQLELVLHDHNLTMETLMVKLTQPCSSLMIKCKWRGELVPCDQLFTMHKTDAGFCCSFNYRPPDKTVSRDPYIRVNGAGYLAGVSMLMDPRLEDYYAALFSFYGLQVLIHAPTDYPEISARGIILAPKKEAFLQVSAAATYSTSNVRLLSTSQRQCLFKDERHLNMSLENTNSTYSYSNCLIKCRLEHMERLCNCTPYFYPDTGNTRQCGLMDVQCLAKHRRVFINLRAPDHILSPADNLNSMSCDCHPTCTDVVYTAEISQGNFFKSEYDRTHFFKEITITNHSILHVYFKDLSVLRFRRDVIYSWNDLLVKHLNRHRENSARLVAFRIHGDQNLKKTALDIVHDFSDRSTPGHMISNAAIKGTSRDDATACLTLSSFLFL
uniref:Sodium channel protein Nach n=1 Tax=Timema cristinae TaxID=61476 RepID=A0A7R9CWR4_TIMCR|nr:unnamed protein product [Timema cristinae]